MGKYHQTVELAEQWLTAQRKERKFNTTEKFYYSQIQNTLRGAKRRAQNLTSDYKQMEAEWEKIFIVDALQYWVYLVFHSCFRMVNYLIMLRVNINSRYYGRSAMYYAITSNNLQMVETLAKHCGAVIDTPVENCGELPLYFAAERGYHEICDFLIFNGANPNMISTTGQTPLHAACRARSNLQTVKVLLKHQAYPWTNTTKGRVVSPLAVALENGFTDRAMALCRFREHFS